MIKSLFSNRWLLAFAIALGVLIALLIAAPMVSKQLARQWLLGHGGTQVRFKDVDLNPFTAALQLEELEVKVDEETTLAFASAQLNLAWIPLFRRQISVESLELTGLHVVVDNRDLLRIGGIHLPVESAPEAEDDGSGSPGWLVGLESFALNDFDIVYRDNDLDVVLQLERLQLTHLTQWSPDEPAELALSGSLNGAMIELNVRLAPLAEEPAYRGTLTVEDLALAPFVALVGDIVEKLEGEVTLASEFSFRQSQEGMTLAHAGKLVLTNLELRSGDVDLQAKNVSWSGKSGFNQSVDETQASHEGEVSLDGIRMTTPQGVVDNETTRWQGETAVNMAGPDWQIRLDTDGTLAVGLTTGDLQQPTLYFETRQVFHEGKFSFATGDAVEPVTVRSDMRVDRLRVAAEEREYRLLSIDALRLDGLAVSGNTDVAFASVEADELYLAPAVEPDDTPDEVPDAFLHIEKTRISKPDYADGVLSIDSVEYDGWQGRLHRDVDGQWMVVRLLDVIDRVSRISGGPERSEASGGMEVAESQPMRFSIGRGEFVGGKNKLTFVDESVSPVFRTELTVRQLKVENLSSAVPEQAASMVLEGNVGKYTELTIRGELQPFRQAPDIDLSGTVRALDLPPLSAFTSVSLGLLLNSGTLDADFDVRTDGALLNGNADLKLRQLQVTGLPVEGGVQSMLPVPLDTALDTLRDKNNTITLEIPVTGDPSDPQFDISDAVGQALAKGVRKGALSYLTFALQPYGSLIAAARYAGETATKVRLNPVGFEPGQAVLGADARDYLGKVADVLENRPQLDIKLCGVAVGGDQVFQPVSEPVDEAEGNEVVVDETALKELARQRATVVKDYLVESFAVSASRLVGCLPRLEQGDSGTVPRTDLLI